jgi:hypothetical protein
MTSPMVLAGNGASAAGPSRVLWLEGDNVLKGPAGGNAYGVLESSIVVTERGPGGVSAMTFVLRDPGKVQTLAEGDDVLYYDLVNDRPEFAGWVQGWAVEPFGLGRAFGIRCQGFEAVLDWLIVTPTFTLPAGMNLTDAIQAVVGLAQGIGFPLRAFVRPGFVVNDVSGNQAGGIAQFQVNLATVTLGSDVTITGPVTLREALAVVCGTGLDFFLGDWGGSSFLPVVTVDFYGGLRAYSPLAGPSDYAGLTVADTFAAALAPENLRHNVDAGGRPHQVWVKGGNAAGTGMVTDGTGIVGPTAVLNNSDILTGDAKRAAGTAYLRDKKQTIRGSFELNGNTIATNVRVGSLLDLTDAETGATGLYAIAEIQRRYAGPRRDWRVSFGGMPLDLSRQIRRLTRGVLS